ncbi:MAG: excinuclease ABC subunit UvrA [Thermodesulfobacteriota bacterium]
MTSDTIIIRGARQHNLKNIDLDLPRNSLVAITGLSGSGKSSLAFDTLYAEGQRRYVESLSTYARQFLERLDKPDVDLIEGLSPAVAIEQKVAGHNPRSTVGTVTEIHDYLRLLYARVGIPVCHQCGIPVTSRTLDQLTDEVMALPEKTRLIILAPLPPEQPEALEKRINRLKKDGFARVRLDGEIVEIEQLGKLSRKKKHTMEVVIDRLIVKDSIRNRLADSLELAMAQSGGGVVVDISDGRQLRFHAQKGCPQCGIAVPEFTPASFSFNSPHGACPKCDGLGTVTEFDPHLIIPNPHLSLREGAVSPWSDRNSVAFGEFLDALTLQYGVDIYTPYKDLPQPFQEVILYGSGDQEIPFYFEKGNRRVVYRKKFEGVIPNLDRRYKTTDSHQTREEIKQYIRFRPCPACHGERLNPASRSVLVGGAGIAMVSALSIADALAFFTSLSLSGKQAIIAGKILKEIVERLGFLHNVGLDYLALNRAAASLSGGESQRIRLATQIGSKLTGIVYVLDEPSIGLHQRDNQRLIETLLKMRDMGNTVVVVEHDRNTIMKADHVVELGPAAGIHGGQVVFTGTPQAMLDDEHSLTGQYFSGRKQIAPPPRRRPTDGPRLSIHGASENNLKQIDVEFPLGCFICVTGVSGSGKSSLVLKTLYPALAQQLYHARIPAGTYQKAGGFSQVDKVIHIDQAPIGRTPRSNPGTYTGLFAHIRDLFTHTPEARVRGFKSGRFSFNVKGGRCEACCGDGIVKIEMHFLPDIYVTCDVCNGRRYNRETLEIRYRGKNIAEILDMTVNQGLSFFARIGAIRAKLETLADVGLGYIHIGQPATTLSGGEAQRVKLARELSKKETGRTVYILDEPTTGLHVDDIQRLLHVLERLVEAGNTVIVIEHNLDVIRYADYIIDLGPEGGEGGGWLVGAGTPEEIAQNEASHTGTFLRAALGKR